jgi:high-affinity iron transporter
MMVGVLTFLTQRKLPYKKMLVFTGLLLLMVLAVMVGETAQEMQQAGWISTTNIPIHIPEWMGVWFCIFPTKETLLAQFLSVIYVLGAYFAAHYITKSKANKKFGANAS